MGTQTFFLKIFNFARMHIFLSSLEYWGISGGRNIGQFIFTGVGQITLLINNKLLKYFYNHYLQIQYFNFELIKIGCTDKYQMQLFIKYDHGSISNWTLITLSIIVMFLILIFLILDLTKKKIFLMSYDD